MVKLQENGSFALFPGRFLQADCIVLGLQAANSFKAKNDLYFFLFFIIVFPCEL